ncbi:MAG: hypothetical protein C4B59_08720 [Candidatus Methanogaster sp.]|uniref:Uncharacterized protein n=1 Tax=Candidatus Methanogaster sp. TaxID=3386292 RepID=A0AC61L2Y8_9EURY|nr:MAG: hypothetical protein C4B59_08720 [ANME-2 cluster archaeon]
MCTNKIRRKKPGSVVPIAVLVLLISTVFVVPVFAATKPDNPIFRDGIVMTAAAGKDTMDLDNGIYSVSVLDVRGCSGEGTYTIATGSGHPVPNENVLWSDANHEFWSTYLTVRVYETGKEYVSTTTGPTQSSGYTVVDLDDCSPDTTLSGNEIHTTWTTGEGLLINQIIAIEGSMPTDSRVRVTTHITNNNDTANMSVGIRYVWDLAIGGEDGSWFAERRPDSDWIDTECEWVTLGFRNYATTNDPNSSIFIVWGNLTVYDALVPPATTPDRLQFVAWGSSGDGVFDHAFDYTPTGQTLAGSGSDSAIAYYWGDDETNAITLSPGESDSVTQYLYVTPPPPLPVPNLTPIGIVTLIGLLTFIGAGVIARRR